MKLAVVVGLCLTCWLPALGAQSPEAIWLSLDADAYAVLQQINPARQAVARRELPLRAGVVDELTEIRVVASNGFERDALLRQLRAAGRHGGFVAHDSLPAALDYLARPRVPTFTPTRPAYVIDMQARVVPMLASVSATRIGDDIQALAAFHNRYYYGVYGPQASDWLADHWRDIAADRDDISVELVYRGSDAMPSVVLTISGSERPDQFVVAGAHLDSINWYSGNLATARSPGADDDASGTASITEILRVLVEHDFHPRRSVQFMAYSGEELGLYGSEYIAAGYKSRQVDVVGMLQLDMTGYKGSVGDIYIVDDDTDAQQNAFLAALAAEYLPELEVGHTICGYGCSDHASWTGNGYYASFPFEAKMGEDSPWIHTENDDWTSIGSNAEHPQKFSRLGLAWVVELAGEGMDRIFANGFEGGTFGTSGD